MPNVITSALEEFEVLVKDGTIASFWVTVQDHVLLIKAANTPRELKVTLSGDMYDSLSTFFYGVDKIKYRSHDYDNLKCFVNARIMIDRLLNREGT